MCIGLAKYYAELIEDEKYWKQIKTITRIIKTFEYIGNPKYFPRGLLTRNRTIVKMEEGITITDMEKKYDVNYATARGYLFTTKKKHEELQEFIEQYLQGITKEKMYIQYLLKKEAITDSSLKDIQKELSIYRLRKQYEWAEQVQDVTFNFRQFVRDWIKNYMSRFNFVGRVMVGVPQSKTVTRQNMYLFVSLPTITTIEGEEKCTCLERGYKLTYQEPYSIKAFAELNICVCKQPFLYKFALSLASSPLQAVSYVERRLRELGLPVDYVISLARKIYNLSSLARGLLAKAVANQMMFVQMHIRQDIPFLPEGLSLTELERLEKQRKEELVHRRGCCCFYPYKALVTDLISTTCYTPSIYGGLAVVINEIYNYNARKIIVSVSAYDGGDSTIKIIRPKTAMTLKSEEGYPLAFVVNDDGSISVKELKGGNIDNQAIIPVGVAPEDLVKFETNFGDIIWLGGDQIKQSYTIILTNNISQLNLTTKVTHMRLFPANIEQVKGIVNSLVPYTTSFNVSYSNAFISMKVTIITTQNVHIYETTLETKDGKE